MSGIERPLSDNPEAHLVFRRRFTTSPLLLISFPRPTVVIVQKGVRRQNKKCHPSIPCRINYWNRNSVAGLCFVSYWPFRFKQPLVCIYHRSAVRERDYGRVSPAGCALPILQPFSPIRANRDYITVDIHLVCSVLFFCAPPHFPPRVFNGPRMEMVNVWNINQKRPAFPPCLQ